MRFTVGADARHCQSASTPVRGPLERYHSVCVDLQCCMRVSPGASQSECIGEEEPSVSNLFVDSWGTGTPVVLVHGSLAIGAEEWGGTATARR